MKERAKGQGARRSGCEHTGCDGCSPVMHHQTRHERVGIRKRGARHQQRVYRRDLFELLVTPRHAREKILTATGAGVSSSQPDNNAPTHQKRIF